jgi:hypothetical protein
LKRFLRFVALPTAIIVVACKMWGAVGEGDVLAGEPAEIIGKYLDASKADKQVLQAGSMDVDIRASVPQLKQQGWLHASRRISSLGLITYRVLRFQGDKTVKNQVIARYLEAEQQARNKQDLSVTPVNYKFKFKGERAAEGDRQVYVFDVTPRKKRLGLFKGEVWLDATSFLPVYERGRLVKNPSIFFKRVQFERAYQIQGGVAVPEYMSSRIDTRLVGPVELNIEYSNFARDGESEEIDECGPQSVAAAASTLP